MSHAWHRLLFFHPVVSSDSRLSIAQDKPRALKKRGAGKSAPVRTDAGDGIGPGTRVGSTLSAERAVKRHAGSEGRLRGGGDGATGTLQGTRSAQRGQMELATHTAARGRARPPPARPSVRQIPGPAVGGEDRGQRGGQWRGSANRTRGRPGAIPIVVPSSCRISDRRRSRTKNQHRPADRRPKSEQPAVDHNAHSYQEQQPAGGSELKSSHRRLPRGLERVAMTVSQGSPKDQGQTAPDLDRDRVRPGQRVARCARTGDSSRATAPTNGVPVDRLTHGIAIDVTAPGGVGADSLFGAATVRLAGMAQSRHNFSTVLKDHPQ